MAADQRNSRVLAYFISCQWRGIILHHSSGVDELEGSERKVGIFC